MFPQINKQLYIIKYGSNCVQSKRRFAKAKDSTLIDITRSNLSDIKKAGTYKTELVIVSPQSSSILVETGKNKIEVLNFCANNYLGLSNNKDLIEAAKKSLDTHGLGLSSVRFICGTQDIHKELEKNIAQFHKKEDSILYASCF